MRVPDLARGRRPRPRPAAASAAAFVAALSLMTGCVRHHLTPGHGEASRQAFAVQVVPNGVAVDDLLRVLDGTSADLVYENYRKSLAIPDTSEELGEAPAFGGEQ